MLAKIRIRSSQPAHDTCGRYLSHIEEDTCKLMYVAVALAVSTDSSYEALHASRLPTYSKLSN